MKIGTAKDAGRFRAACGSLVVALLAGCGGGSVAGPSGRPAAQIGGAWTGTATWLRDTCAPLHDPTEVDLAFTQTGDALEVRFGSIEYEGSVDASGAFVAESRPLTDPGVTSSISGTASGDAIVATVTIRTESNEMFCENERRLELVRSG